MNLQDLFESQQTCPHCGGPAFSDLLLAEAKDACYNKVRSRYKVWPSAYASGALVQCRKKGAANWGNKSKNESIEQDVTEDPETEYNTRQMFDKHDRDVEDLGIIGQGEHWTGVQRAKQRRDEKDKEQKQGVAEAGPFSYGKAPRKGSVADLAAKKRKEQDRKTPPIEPKDQMVGVARVTKGVTEGSEDLELYGLRIGDTVKATIGLKKVQGDVIDIFPETQQVELLLRGANAGRTVVVDVQDTQQISERALNEFDPTPQLAPPEIEQDKPVDVIIYGRMPEHFRAEDVWAALEEVLPQEYPRRPSNDGPAQHKTAEIAKNGGAVVTTKPQSVANKLVKTFQTYGIRARIG